MSEHLRDELADLIHRAEKASANPGINRFSRIAAQMFFIKRGAELDAILAAIADLTSDEWWIAQVGKGAVGLADLMAKIVRERLKPNA